MQAHLSERPVLETQGVSLLSPAGAPILDDLSIDVRAGERLAIIGPNGAGKTSLLRVCVGLARPDAGAVLLEGRRAGSLGGVLRARRIAFVSQHQRADPRLTVTEYVGLGRIPHRSVSSAVQDREAVASAMERLGLAGLARRRIGKLSGGEQQRAAIARAVAQQPVLLVLDEPTNHLDLHARARVLRLVRGLGIAVIAVLHDLACVPGFADRVAVLQRGRLVAYGPVDAALSDHVVRRVFGLNHLRLQDPATAKVYDVFDTVEEG